MPNWTLLVHHNQVVYLQNKVSNIYRYFVIVFNKTIIPLALVGYEMINQLGAMTAIATRFVACLPSRIQRALVE